MHIYVGFQCNKYNQNMRASLFLLQMPITFFPPASSVPSPSARLPSNFPTYTPSLNCSLPWPWKHPALNMPSQQQSSQLSHPLPSNLPSFHMPLQITLLPIFSTPKPFLTGGTPTLSILVQGMMYASFCVLDLNLAGGSMFSWRLARHVFHSSLGGSQLGLGVVVRGCLSSEDSYSLSLWVILREFSSLSFLKVISANTSLTGSTLGSGYFNKASSILRESIYFCNSLVYSAYCVFCLLRACVQVCWTSLKTMCVKQSTSALISSLRRETTSLNYSSYSLTAFKCLPSLSFNYCDYSDWRVDATGVAISMVSFTYSTWKSGSSLMGNEASATLSYYFTCSISLLYLYQTATASTSFLSDLIDAFPSVGVFFMVLSSRCSIFWNSAKKLVFSDSCPVICSMLFILWSMVWSSSARSDFRMRSISYRLIITAIKYYKSPRGMIPRFICRNGKRNASRCC